MACGLCIALLINSRLVRRKNFYKVCYYIPYVSSMVAVAIVFSLVFNSSPNGIMNQILGKLGIAPVGWLSNDKWAMFVVVLLSVWKELGYVMVIYTGGLLSISQDIYEAVSLDPHQQLEEVDLYYIADAQADYAVSAGCGDDRQFSGVHAGADHDQRRSGVQHDDNCNLPLPEGFSGI